MLLGRVSISFDRLDLFRAVAPDVRTFFVFLIFLLLFLEYCIDSSSEREQICVGF